MVLSPTQKLNPPPLPLPAAPPPPDIPIHAPCTGLSGRVWSLPFVIINRDIPGSGSTNVTSSLSEREITLSTALFIREHAPEIFEECMFIADSSSQMSLLANPQRVLLGRPPPRSPDEIHHPPQFVETPIITKEHWYYFKHFNVGQNMAHVADREAACHIEIKSDLACLRSFLSLYDKLARDYSGQNLFNATHWPGLTDPYFSCMQLCLGELALAPHFLTLINYGIGLQFTNITAQFMRTPVPIKVFDTLVALYLEDFPLSLPL